MDNENGDDISRLLQNWEYQPGQVVVRRLTGDDGGEKIQLRVDLGLLQMNTEGRPDGKCPMGHPSLLEYHQARLHKHVAAHNGSDEGFKLSAEECGKLQLEFLQFHHRYICLLQLEDYPSVVRDAERNLAVVAFATKHAETDELAWSLKHFQPQLLMVLTRAKASQAMAVEDFDLAIQHTEEGMERLREFFRSSPNPEGAEHSAEILSLEHWLEEVRLRRPLSRREQLERALKEAVKVEDYERAAKVRDQIQKLATTE